MIKKLKITLITATYSSSATIADCIKSVNEQSFKYIEHIIIDGASMDNTMEVINGTPNRITQIVSEPDKGIYDAFNKGIALATGDVIGYLHADDIFSSDTILQKIADTFENKTIDGVFGNLVFLTAEGKTARTWQSKAFRSKDIRFGWMPPHPTLFLRKKVYEKHGTFDTSFRISGDYDFMLRIMKDPEINLAYLPETITKMRIGGVSTGSLKNIIKKSQEDLRALSNNGFRYPLAILAAKNIRKLPQLFKK